ncbi:MAG: toll/interleukin-1 receptor domain-containing protein, partial [Pseudomonadota bacterium]|nr:toll/interleukin-1 receptor domain-containing protein [Pseudomonadota bacterium]
MTTNAGHVFVSHGSENREQANEIAAFLESRGIRIWIAPRDVRPGMDYSEQLQGAIEQSAAFLVLVTEKANKSPYVRVETELAFSLDKPIFPVRIGDVKPGAGLALFLKIKHWTDAFGPHRDANMERLASELQALSPTSAGAGAVSSGEPAPPPS